MAQVSCAQVISVEEMHKTDMVGTSHEADGNYHVPVLLKLHRSERCTGQRNSECDVSRDLAGKGSRASPLEV